MRKFMMVLSFIAAAAMSIAFPGCSCRGGGGGKNVEIPLPPAGPDPNARPEIPETEYCLFADGKSDYTIVLPESAAVKEIMAGDELITFFKRSTGFDLPVVYEAEDFEFDEESQYIFIGKTAALEGLNLDVSRAAVTTDGYRIYRKHQSVFIAGGSQLGTLYGVYEFMGYSFGFEAYTKDEIKVEKKTEMRLLDFNVTDIPDFEQRMLGVYNIINDELYRNRLRSDRHGDRWIYGSHSHFRIMPPATYLSAHSNWYSPDGTQLCLTNTEMRAEFVKNLKNIIQNASRERDYILLGAEDDNTFCGCQNCRDAIRDYGSPSAVDMRFLNAVAEEIEAWLKETDPTRELTLGTFAYLKTYDPPAVYDETTKTWSPSHPSVVARDNVLVMIAPLGANYSYGFDNAENLVTRKALDGWQSVTKKFAIWTYSANFHNYMVNFHNYGTLAGHYKAFKAIGTMSLHDQAAWDTPTVSFSEMRAYVHCKMMWNSNFSYEGLVDDFIANYFRDAAPFMKDYYNITRSYSELLRETEGVDATLYVDMVKQQYWPRGYLEGQLALFDKALAAVEKYRSSDPVLFERLTLRIKKERLSVLFFYLNFYISVIDSETAEAWVDEFESLTTLFQVTHWYESMNKQLGDNTIAGVIQTFRTKLK